MATTIKIPAMGQTLELGQLWDARRQEHFAGLSLWSSKEIEWYQQIQSCESSEFFFDVSEQERHTNFGLDVEASLSLSLGIVTVEGSAKYLKEKQENTHEVIMSATCKVNTRVRRIRQEDLVSIKYADVLANDNVTHFVAEVVEGGSATMSFRMAVTDQTEKDTLEGSLTIGVKTYGIDGSGKVELDTLQESHGKSLTIKFCGDYALDRSPTTLETAAAEVNSFAEKLKGMTRTLQVVLLPVSLVDSTAIRICRSLAGDVMIDASMVLANLQSCGFALKELSLCEPMKLFPGIQVQVTSFHAEISKRTTKFREQLCHLLPKAKGLGTDEVDSEIAQIVKTAMQWGKVTNDFLKYQHEQMQHVTELIMDSTIKFNGFENNLARPVPAAPDEPVFLLNMSSIDDVEDMHQLQIDLDKKKGKKGASVYKWWKDASARDVINIAIKRKSCSDAVKFKATYLVGTLPSASDDEDDSEAADASLTLHTFHQAKWVSWVPPVAPSSLIPVAENPRSIKLTWKLADDADSYKVTCEEPTSGNAWTKETSAASTTFTDLQPDTEYRFAIVSIRKHQGACLYDGDSTVTLRTPREPSLAVRLVETIKQDRSAGKIVQTKGNIDRVIAVHATEFERFSSESPKVQTVRCVMVAPSFMPDEEFGEMSNAIVIIATGETGSGKTTHLNALFNFLMGVRIDDPFRLVLVDETKAKSGVDSVTQFVTIYKIRCLSGMPVNRSILLVDSPGFGDTRGLAADAFVTLAFRAVFAELTHLNCVALVTNSTNERLTPKGKMIVERMLNLFHKQVKDNIVPVCTFADSGTPLCIAGLTQDKVPFKKYVKVQNSAFAGRVEEQDGSMQVGKVEEDKLHWHLAETGIRSFLKVAQESFPQELGPSSTVLQQRQNLTDELQCLSGALQMCSTEIGEVVTSLDYLALFLGSVPKEKVCIKKPVTKKISISGQSKYVTNCMKCNMTCHAICAYDNNEDKVKCSAMDSEGQCRICTNNCHWSSHHNADHYFEVSWVEEWVIPQELVNEWGGKNGSVEKAILNSLDSLEEKQRSVNKLLENMIALQQQLETNSLRHNPSVLLAYVDSLIESQRAQGASQSMLKSLQSAKTALNLCARADRVMMQEAAKSKVMSLITTKLRSRAALTPTCRASSAKEPSDFYNQCLDIVGLDIVKHYDFPKRLAKNNFGLGWYPAFSESLESVGKMLQVLLRM